MKKNISINISGIIFHIEEDGYDLLKGYLDAISRYFSSYEDNEEIVADIEGRIAEIFLEKLQDDKQVISKEDIDSLIQTMGQIADFEAMESEPEISSTQKEEPKAKQQTKQNNKSSSTGSRKLERDTQRQLIGGVCAGLAHYFRTDPIWIRGLFLLFLFGGGLSLVVYAVLWIALSGNDDIPENDSVRKLYRDPDDKVIGGVSGGLAKYFRTDPLLFRILFIVFTFSGFGILAYVVLWIITPKANSLTDRMQMTGEKVTISNIDSTIKKKREEELNPKDENTFTKILLFPFRLISKIFSGLGRAIAPLFLFIVAAIRVFTGGIITLIAVSVMFSLVVTAGVLFGLYNGDWFLWEPEWTYFPYEVFENTIPGIGVLFLVVAIFIPFLYLFIAGITVIAKRRVMSSSFGWSILGIWIIAIFGSFAILPNIVRDFRDEGIYRETEQLTISADTLTIKTERVDNEYESFYGYRSRRSFDHESEFADLDIRPSKDGRYRIEKRFRARGRTPDVASEHAQEVTYGFQTEGNELIFDNDITFPRGAKFYFQEVDVDLYIPANQPFKIDRDARNLIRYLRYGYSWWEISRNVWMFDEDGQLICLSCEDETEDNTMTDGDASMRTLEEFNSIELDRAFEATFIPSEDHQIELSGPSYLINDIVINNNDNQLNIKISGNYNENWNRVKLTIYGSTLDKINLRNGAELDLQNFNNEYLVVNLYHDSRLNLEGELNELDIYAYGTARADLLIKAEKAKLHFTDESRVYGYDSQINEAEIDTESEARVRIAVANYMRARADGFSSIRYKGDPTIDIVDKSRSASISRY